MLQNLAMSAPGYPRLNNALHSVALLFIFHSPLLHMIPHFCTYPAACMLGSWLARACYVASFSTLSLSPAICGIYVVHVYKHSDYCNQGTSTHSTNERLRDVRCT